MFYPPHPAIVKLVAVGLVWNGLQKQRCRSSEWFILSFFFTSAIFCNDKPISDIGFSSLILAPRCMSWFCCMLLWCQVTPGYQRHIIGTYFCPNKPRLKDFFKPNCSCYTACSQDKIAIDIDARSFFSAILSIKVHRKSCRS